MARPSSTSGSRRSRRTGRFPWALAGALLIVAVVEVTLQFAAPLERFPYWNGAAEYPAAALAIDRRGPADVCIVGASRARDGLLVGRAREVMAVLDKTGNVDNYACAGAGPTEIEALVRRILREPGASDAAKPRLIVYGLSPLTLWDLPGDLPGKRWMELPEWRWKFTGDGAASLPYLPFVARNELRKRVALCRYREALGAIQMGFYVFGEPRFGQYGGGLPIFHEWFPEINLVTRPVDDARVQRYLRRLLPDPGAEPEEDNLAALRRTVDLCRRRGVEIVFLEMPYADILESRLPEGVRERFEAEMAVLEAAGGHFVSIEDLGETFVDGEFHDQSHLNEAGARKMTAAIVRLLARRNRL
jgi:hypothetical protein